VGGGVEEGAAVHVLEMAACCLKRSCHYLQPPTDNAIINLPQQEPVSADAFGGARALDLFLLGCQSRVVGTTNLNLRSSRAHAIYTLHLSRRPAAEPGVTYTSKLHIVDLAGSERCKRTKAEGTRMKEAISINSGLLVLQKVMAALQLNSRRGADAREHVPYRESRLTRLLQVGGWRLVAVGRGWLRVCVVLLALVQAHPMQSSN